MQRFTIALFLLSFAALTCTWGQGTQTRYGKNRVQFHNSFDEWMKYESNNFLTYWYGDGRNIGQFVVQIAEYDFEAIQNILEHRINDKIQIIVYTDLTDLKQSNIGSEEAFTNTGGQTKIVGNKIFVYFNGDHNDLRRQVREGVASVYLDAMLFGSNLQEIVQNAVMMNLPDWFKDGLVAYVGEAWNTTLDDQLRDAFLNEDFEDFESLAEENPKLAGHSLWYFIGENFGQATVSNLLYLTRINRSVESGFLYVLGSPYEVVLDSWKKHFGARYNTIEGLRTEPDTRLLKVKNKRNLPISQVKISPDGKQLIYVANEIGRYKVYLHDLYKDERTILLKDGFRNAFQATDYNYPLIAWNPNNTEVAIIYEKRDNIKLLTYDVFTKKQEVSDMAPNYQRIHNVTYIDPFTMTFSAMVEGYSDIFLYFPKTRQSERITQDFYDDLDVSYVKMGEERGLLFASNRKDSMLISERLDTMLPINNFDIYYYDLNTKSKELVRVTNTPFASERQPMAVDSTYFSYLTDESGIYNRKMAFLEEYLHHYDQVITLEDGTEIVLHADSALTKLDTTLIDTIELVPVIKKRAIAHSNSNYDRNILTQNSAPRVGRMAELVFRDNSYQIRYGEMMPDTTILAPVTPFQRERLQSTPTKYLSPRPTTKRAQEEERRDPLRVLEEAPEITVDETTLPAAKQDTGKIDIDNYLFQSEFDDEETPVTIITKPETSEPQEDKDKPVEEPINIDVVSSANTAQGRQTTEDAEGNEKKVYRFRPGRITPYRLQFRTDFVTTQLDNSLLFEGMDSHAANPDQYTYPPPGILFKANFKDLFEDYEFEGGMRLPTTFNGAEYFLTFKDKKKRLDKTYAVYRRNQRFTEESSSFVAGRREVNVLLGQFGVSYPLDIFRSIRATGTIRRDRVMHLATDRSSLERPTDREQRIGLKLEYVFDNTLDVQMNIKNGTRYKVYAEVMKRFRMDFADGFEFEFKDGFMGILGVDARHYQRIDKYSIFAVRMAGATSFGDEKMLYFLGGVDNWLFPSRNTDIPIPNGDFAFQTLASNMRGFRLNIRNGNSFALINSELRVPLFRYFSKNIRSSFFRNFQVVGFFDVGTAWAGLTPYSDDNPLNTTTFTRGDLVSIKVTYFRDPIVAGYGIGVRSMLFGYFVRLDYAWGIETKQVQDPRLYLSLGMDF